MFEVVNGDCLEVLKTLDDNSMDSAVMDPPGGTSFLGCDWDSDRGGMPQWIEWLSSVLDEVHRILKPGAHGLIWCMPRTSHWTGLAIELSPLEIRDVIVHLYGSGFVQGNRDLGKYVSEDLKGMGTLLKRGQETWYLVRKDVEGTIGDNVLKHGTGGLNIDGCRILYGEGDELKGKVIGGPVNGDKYGGSSLNKSATKHPKEGIKANDIGRWPTNLVLTHSALCDSKGCDESCPIQELDQQSGVKTSGSRKAGDHKLMGFMGAEKTSMPEIKGSTGGASRYFPNFKYCAKPNRGEKEAGLDSMPLKSAQALNSGGINAKRAAKAERAIESQGVDSRGRTLIREDGTETMVSRFIPGHRANMHPTVKPIEFMRWLCKLVTPPGGKVLDPFCGSGSTGCAAVTEGFDFFGIELDAEYCEISRRRIAWWALKGTRQFDKNEETDKDGVPVQGGLFD